MYRFDDDGPSLGSQLLHAVHVAPPHPVFRARAARPAAAPAPQRRSAPEREGREDDGDDGAGGSLGSQEGDAMGESGDDEAPGGGAPLRAGVKRSRHAPAELPSTRGVSRHRQVVAVPTAVRRDPRYEETAGTLKGDLFKKSYAFLDARRAEELQALQRDAKRTKDPEQARALQGEITRRKQAAAEAQRLEALKASQRALKRGAQEAVAGGARPYFPKQRELKELEAVERFKALEAAGGASAVEKALKKRRVTLSKKDRTRLPAKGGARGREGE